VVHRSVLLTEAVVDLWCVSAARHRTGRVLLFKEISFACCQPQSCDLRAVASCNLELAFDTCDSHCTAWLCYFVCAR
jgi:hypothetical protein